MYQKAKAVHGMDLNRGDMAYLPVPGFGPFSIEQVAVVGEGMALGDVWGTRVCIRYWDDREIVKTFLPLDTMVDVVERVVY